jgi:hypothetical protein
MDLQITTWAIPPIFEGKGAYFFLVILCSMFLWITPASIVKAEMKKYRQLGG